MKQVSTWWNSPVYIKQQLWTVIDIINKSVKILQRCFSSNEDVGNQPLETIKVLWGEVIAHEKGYIKTSIN